MPNEYPEELKEITTPPEVSSENDKEFFLEDDPLVGRELSFSYHKKGGEEMKSIPVKITRVIEQISGLQGFSDWVKLVDTNVDGKIRRFVIKKIGGKALNSKYTERTNLLKHLDHISRMHKLLRLNKINSFPTYRINIKEGLVLMTNGQVDDRLIFSYNNTGRKQHGEYLRCIDDFTDFDVMLNEIYNQMQICRDAGIYVHPDAFGFSLQEQAFTNQPDKNKTDIKALVFDLDQVSTEEPRNPHYSDSRVNLAIALLGNSFGTTDSRGEDGVGFLYAYMKVESAERYRKIVLDFFEKNGLKNLKDNY